MPDYQKGKIYKIVSIIPELEGRCYVGSTIQPLAKRWGLHKKDCKRKNANIQQTLKQYGVENFKIVLIELFPCNSKEELTGREEYWIRKLDSVKSGWNCHYAKQNIEGYKEKREVWIEKNKDKLRKNMKIYREENKDKRKIYWEENKDKINQQRKLYWETYKVKKKEKLKQYYEENKDKINQQRRERRARKKQEQEEKI